jgi:transposase
VIGDHVCVLRHAITKELSIRGGRGHDTHVRSVVILRDVHHETWAAIAAKVKNLRGESPSVQTVTNVYDSFAARHGRVKTKYANCGRKKWKMTPDIEKFVIRRLRQLRSKCVCTATTLQHVLAREKNVRVHASCIRKVLLKHGYNWLPRSQKRKYSAEVCAERVAFAEQVVAMSAAKLRERLSLAMDGVVLTMPPSPATDRWNFCKRDANLEEAFGVS